MSRSPSPRADATGHLFGADMTDHERGRAAGRGLDAFRPAPAARLYCQPRTLLCGRAARAAVEVGTALPLAAGPYAFTTVRLWSREPGVVPETVEVAVPALVAWVEAGVAAGDRRPAALLARLTAERPPFAGLSVAGPSAGPRLMGVLNVTPDSFSDGGRFADVSAAIVAGEALFAQGADIVDVGGESTRPGAASVTVAEELARVTPVIEGLAGRGPLSIDTRHAAVMRAALAAGATIVNDVTALGDAGSLSAVAEAGAGVMLMHMQGAPATMQVAPRYQHAMLDVYDALADRVAVCEAAGIARGRICVDPGIGFGKTLADNLTLLAGLTMLHGLGCAVALGVSRKSFIGRLTGEEQPALRLPGSLAAGLAAMERGVQVLRVHDVGATAQAVAVWRAIRYWDEVGQREYMV